MKGFAASLSSNGLPGETQCHPVTTIRGRLKCCPEKTAADRKCFRLSLFLTCDPKANSPVTTSFIRQGHSFNSVASRAIGKIQAIQQRFATFVAGS